VEAEAVDVILVESLDKHPETYEIDTTDSGPEEVAENILRVVNGDASEFRAGNVDWSEVILAWY
jgi:broad-specificity NMP kinase